MDKLKRAIILSIISIGLFAAIGAVLPGISAFDPIEKALNDIAVTDIFYAAERDDSPVVNDRFLIIDTSDSDRREIAEAITHAAEAEAAVIGVDIIFSDATADSAATAALCSAMTGARNLIVAAVHLNQWDDASQSYISTVSTATDSLSLDPGYTNFLTDGDYSYIRNYTVSAPGSMPSFAQAVADKYRRIYGDDSALTPTDEGIIDFSPQTFDIIDAADLAAIDSLALGRMVLLGATASDEDYHFTPIGSMSGVMIQAYAADTLLSNPSAVAPQWVVWLICVILVLAASVGFIAMRDSFESRNPTANRYTYAVLGLGNIIYPTVIILIVILAVGLLYLTASVYLPPLVIVGSLAFIPVAYDLLGISRGILSRRAKTTACSIILALATFPADAKDQEPSYIDEIEFLNKNCPFKDGKPVQPKHEYIRSAISDMMDADDFSCNDYMLTALYEYLLGSIYPSTNVEAASFCYLNAVDSPDLKTGADILKSFFEDKNQQLFYSQPYCVNDRYKLALCYYFGLGTKIDYSKSREHLNCIFETLKGMSPSDWPDMPDMIRPEQLNLLGSSLRAKGFPNKVCDAVHGSMADYTYAGHITDKFISDCEAALLHEDPENLLAGFPNCKITVSPFNFILFYPAVVKSGISDKFLRQCDINASNWIDYMMIGLCYYHHYDRSLHTFSFHNRLDQTSSLSHYDEDGLDVFVSASYFKKAFDKFSKETAKKISPEAARYIDLFINVYQSLADNKSPEKEAMRLNTLAAAISKLLESKYGYQPFRAFATEHNNMIYESRGSGDPVARYLLGIMYSDSCYHNSDYGRIGRDYEKAHALLSEWQGRDHGKKFNFKDLSDRLMLAIDYACFNTDNGFAEAAGYEYSLLPPLIPTGEFYTELNHAARVVMMRKELAAYGDIFSDKIKEFINDDDGQNVAAEAKPANPATPATATKPADPKATGTAPQKPKVNFAFRTPDKTKFSEPEFDLTFVTNSRTASYRISGSEPRDIPAEALAAGKLRVELPLRDCEITLVDESNRMHFLSFIYDEAAGLRKSATLHILSIGLNNYNAPNLSTLKFAEADAEAVVDAFVKRHQYTFSNIHKTTLLGNDVTRNRIEREIETICETAKPNDLAVIFFAGHGLVDSRNYYLVTADVKDADKPNIGGMSASLFKEKISYIPCKLVVFIDACHSAKIFDAYRGNDFFKELQTTRNGTSIYTSSSPDEKSRENAVSGHGFFTQALLEACDFDKSDTNDDGRITIKEIRNYLEQRIPQLTSNGQTPVYRNLEEIDYSVFIKP